MNSNYLLWYKLEYLDVNYRVIRYNQQLLKVLKAIKYLDITLIADIIGIMMSAFLI